jgi:hypothetical protein
MFRYAYLHLLKTNDDEYYNLVLFSLKHAARGFVYVLDAFFKTNVTSYITKSSFTVLFIPRLIHGVA